MGRSQETFGKKEKEKKRLKKREEKKKKAEERKANSLKGGSLEEMFAYVDEDGNITDTPPDPTKKKKIINPQMIEVSVAKREKEEMPAVREGRVDFFNDSKGFGFIKEFDTGEKYFVHINGVIDEIAENDKVSFELERGMKGMNAVRVKKI